MYTPRQIVVPVDFSETSRAAAERALMIADAFGAPIHLVHALRLPMAQLFPDCGIPPDTWDAIRRETGEKLQKLETEFAQRDVAVSSELIEAEPVHAIQSAVARRNANLVVMGTHGRGGLQRAFLGSVAARVLRTLHCPTLAVKEQPDRARARIARILFATDFSIHSERAAVVAHGIAKRFSATVEILHVLARSPAVMGLYGVPTPPGVFDDLRDDARERLEQTARKIRGSGIFAERHLAQGIASQVITREAARFGADLIVMGTRGRTGLKHVLLGSVAERTLHAAPCSVLTVQDGDAT